MTKAPEAGLKGFSQTLAELEWLLLILVLVYFIVPSSVVINPWYLTLSMILFASFVLSFRYSKLFILETRWKLAAETWAIILFISWVVYNTGGIESPLINLYLLVIMFSALTLGRGPTLLIFLLITTVYFYLSYITYAEQILTFASFSKVMILFCPYLLVGYVTTLLASDVHKSQEELALLSHTDDLTGLKNRRAFENDIVIEVKKAVRYQRPFSIMMLDADNLKSTNDRYGHSVGDELIKSLSRLLQESVRETDILARYGGDEFIILLPETTGSKALEIAERFRLAVENSSFEADSGTISSTFSIGIASFPEDGEVIDDLIEEADQALYESKQKGKNRVTRQSLTHSPSVRHENSGIDKIACNSQPVDS